MKPLKERDFFQELEVTKISDNFCFFGKKRMSWSKIEKLLASGEKIQFQLSPNKLVDWKNKEQVLNYHSCFKFWNTYISGYSDKFKIHEGIFEVKDSLVFYNEEYFLPSPVLKHVDNQTWWNAKQEFIPNGKYNVQLLKHENDWYALKDVERGNITLNLFILGSAVVDSIQCLKPNTEELWASHWGDGINFEYETSMWEGLSFSLRSLDIVKLFRKYFVNHRWTNDKYIDINDSEINKLLYPIENELISILKTALYQREFHVSINESWGEVSVSNMLQFNKNVAEKVFTLITNQIQNT